MGSFQNSTWFEQFCAESVEKNYARGALFNLQGETLNSVGLIMSGTAGAFSYSINGDETWLGEYSEGQFMGLMSLLTQDNPSFEIRATTNLAVRVLSHDKMLKLIKEDVTLCEAVASDLASRLTTSMTDLVNINTLSVRGRICAELIRLAIPIGVDPDRHIIRPSPIFVELARRLNSSRETVSRTVSDLQKKGILAREPGVLIIENPERLQDAIEYI